MTENLPAYIRARNILDIIDQNESYESSQQKTAWDLAYAGTMEDSQAVFDALPLVTNKGESPITALQVGFDSKVQGVSHNICYAVRRDPALLGNPKVQALLSALDAFQGDEKFPEILKTTPPYLFNANPNFSVTLRENEAEEN